MHKEMSNCSLNYIYKVVMPHFYRMKRKNRIKIWNKNSRVVRRIILKQKCSYILFLGGGRLVGKRDNIHCEVNDTYKISM